MLQVIPNQYHEGAVGNYQIGFEQSFAIGGVVRKVFERGGSRHHQKTAIFHPLHCLDGVTDKEVNS